MFLQAWKHLTKKLFPSHCYDSLISVLAVTHWPLSNGSHCLPSVSRLSVLLEDFRAQLPSLSVPGPLIFCDSYLNHSHHTQGYTLDLTIAWFINHKIKKQNKTKTPSEHNLVFFQLSFFLRIFTFHYLYFSFPISSRLYFFTLPNLDSMVHYFSSLFPLLILFQETFPEFPFNLPALFIPVAYSNHLDNFSRFLHTMISWFSSYLSAQFHC